MKEYKKEIRKEEEETECNSYQKQSEVKKKQIQLIVFSTLD